MAKKISFDQTSAWIVSVVVTATMFTGGYSLLKRMGNGHTTRQFNVQEMEDPDGGHGKSEHSESSNEDKDSHEKNAHNDEPAKSDEEASPTHSDHDSDEKHHDTEKQEEGRHKPMNAEKVVRHEPKEDHDSSVASDKHTAVKHDVHWAYEGENGPEIWGKLSPQFVDCQDGRAQSPINLENAKGQRDLRPLKFSYAGIEARLENNGHTLASKIEPGNFLTFNGSRSGLFNFHFHIPSEHLVGGVPYEMEMHLVHKNEKGNLTVVGLFIEEGDSPNPLLEKIWQELPAKVGKFGPIVSINLREFLPEDTSYYAYNGSLTTPPCSEAVQWLVVRKSIKASSKQIDAFAHIYRNNARPAQPLYNRKVEKLVSR